MSIGNTIFIDRFLKLDLHGYDRYTARVAINDFIVDAIKMRQEIIVIVHGIGTGILKHTVIETLKGNKNVEEFAVSYYNPGCTIVKIR